MFTFKPIVLAAIHEQFAASFCSHPSFLCIPTHGAKGMLHHLILHRCDPTHLGSVVFATSPALHFEADAYRHQNCLSLSRLMRS